MDGCETRRLEEATKTKRKDDLVHLASWNPLSFFPVLVGAS